MRGDSLKAGLDYVLSVQSA